VCGKLKAKFHYANWFKAGSKLHGRSQVRSRFEAGRRPESELKFDLSSSLLAANKLSSTR